jgi:hypothetical protein
MLCHRHTDAEDIDLLKAVSADLIAGHIARHRNDRNGRGSGDGDFIFLFYLQRG